MSGGSHLRIRSNDYVVTGQVREACLPRRRRLFRVAVEREVVFDSAEGVVRRRSGCRAWAEEGVWSVGVEEGVRC
jgi:hypothetical protein